MGCRQQASDKSDSSKSILHLHVVQHCQSTAPPTTTLASCCGMQANITMVYNASFAMASPSASNMSLLTLRPGLNSSAVAAAGSNSSLLLLAAPSNTTLGSRVYVVLNLRTALGRSLLQVANVDVTVTGRHARTVLQLGNPVFVCPVSPSFWHASGLVPADATWWLRHDGHSQPPTPAPPCCGLQGQSLAWFSCRLWHALRMAGGRRGSLPARQTP